MDIEKRMMLIESRVAQDKRKKDAAIDHKKSQTEVLLAKVRGLQPRIRDLLVLADKCRETGLALPGKEKTAKCGYGEGCVTFEADGIHHKVGFMKPLACQGQNFWSEGHEKICYVGFRAGGACGKWDFYTNGETSFLLHEDSREKAAPDLPSLRTFLEELFSFESAFYCWIDSLMDDGEKRPLNAQEVYLAAQVEIDYFPEKLGEIVWDACMNDDNNTAQITKGIQEVLRCCVSLHDFQIADEMLSAVCGYNTHSLIDNIRERDREGHPWECLI